MKLSLKKVILIGAIIAIVPIAMMGSRTVRQRNNSITEKPKRYSNAFKVDPALSSINASMDVDLRDVELAVNEALTQPYNLEGEGKFSETYSLKTKNPLYIPNEWIKTKNPTYNPNKWIKTKNPTYNPNKWIKTKNPTYNPNKWIKNRYFKTKNPLYNPTEWIETKNPLYNPTEWIETKNPAYNPTEWIEAKETVEVGYQYQASISKNGIIELSSPDTKTLRISAPLEVKGSAGFTGPFKKLGILDKKNFKVSVIANVDITGTVDEEWCPTLDGSLALDWQSGPKIEVIGGLWVDFKIARKITDSNLKSLVEEEIASVIDCDKIRNEIQQVSLPSSVALQDSLDGLYLNITPKSVSIPTMTFDQDYMRLGLGVESLLEFSDTPSQTKGLELPPLTSKPIEPNLLVLNVPLKLNYSLIESRLNENSDLINGEIEALIREGKTNALEALEELALQNFELYPSGENLVLGADVKLKSSSSLLSTKGRMYLSSDASFSESRIFSLENVRLSGEVENPLYQLAFSTLSDFVNSLIEKHSVYDASQDIETLVENAILSLESELEKEQRLSVEVINPSLGLEKDFHYGDQQIIKPISISTGFDVKVNVLPSSQNQSLSLP